MYKKYKKYVNIALCSMALSCVTSAMDVKPGQTFDLENSQLFNQKNSTDKVNARASNDSQTLKSRKDKLKSKAKSSSEENSSSQEKYKVSGLDNNIPGAQANASSNVSGKTFFSMSNWAVLTALGIATAGAIMSIVSLVKADNNDKDINVQISLALASRDQTISDLQKVIAVIMSNLTAVSAIAQQGYQRLNSTSSLLGVDYQENNEAYKLYNDGTVSGDLKDLEQNVAILREKLGLASAELEDGATVLGKVNTNRDNIDTLRNNAFGNEDYTHDDSLAKRMSDFETLFNAVNTVDVAAMLTDVTDFLARLEVLEDKVGHVTSNLGLNDAAEDKVNGKTLKEQVEQITSDVGLNIGTPQENNILSLVNKLFEGTGLSINLHKSITVDSNVIGDTTIVELLSKIFHNAGVNASAEDLAVSLLSQIQRLQTDTGVGTEDDRLSGNQVLFTKINQLVAGTGINVNNPTTMNIGGASRTTTLLESMQKVFTGTGVDFVDPATIQFPSGTGFSGANNFTGNHAQLLNVIRAGTGLNPNAPTTFVVNGASVDTTNIINLLSRLYRDFGINDGGNTVLDPNLLSRMTIMSTNTGVSNRLLWKYSNNIDNMINGNSLADQTQKLSDNAGVSRSYHMQDSSGNNLVNSLNDKFVIITFNTGVSNSTLSQDSSGNNLVNSLNDKFVIITFNTGVSNSTLSQDSSGNNLVNSLNDKFVIITFNTGVSNSTINRDNENVAMDVNLRNQLLNILDDLGLDGTSGNYDEGELDTFLARIAASENRIGYIVINTGVSDSENQTSAAAPSLNSKVTNVLADLGLTGVADNYNQGTFGTFLSRIGYIVINTGVSDAADQTSAAAPSLNSKVTNVLADLGLTGVEDNYNQVNLGTFFSRIGAAENRIGYIVINTGVSDSADQTTTAPSLNSKVTNVLADLGLTGAEDNYNQVNLGTFLSRIGYIVTNTGVSDSADQTTTAPSLNSKVTNVLNDLGLNGVADSYNQGTAGTFLSRIGASENRIGYIVINTGVSDSENQTSAAAPSLNSKVTNVLNDLGLNGVADSYNQGTAGTFLSRIGASENSLGIIWVNTGVSITAPNQDSSGNSMPVSLRGQINNLQSTTQTAVDNIISVYNAYNGPDIPTQTISKGY